MHLRSLLIQSQMKRHIITPRPNWIEKAEEIGFTYHTSGTASEDGDGTYWDESIAYEFSVKDVEQIENATLECNNRCLDLVERVVGSDELLAKLGIPGKYYSAIRQSWRNDEPTLYGRFDFAYDGESEPKMLEYNADTPTMVIETALMQWFWLQDVKPGHDQFNSLHEKLLEQFRYIRGRVGLGERFYFAGYEENLEEYQTCRYFQDLATQAGLNCDFIDLGDIGWNGSNFVNLQGAAMRYWFKLYPWEWMMTDEFGEHLAHNSSGIVEPIWKAILSNKGILPLLYEMFPSHPNILPASFNNDLPADDQEWYEFQANATAEELELFGKGELSASSYVVKPMLSREGANIDIVESGRVVKRTGGNYTGPRIYQKKANLYEEGGSFAVIGSWVVGDEAAGMVVRDNPQQIVLDTSKVVPHWISWRC